MKKILLFALIVLVGISLTSFVFADEARYIAKKGKVLTSSQVVSTAGVVVYKVTGYAGSANSIYGLYNCGTLPETTVANCKVEGGEATQYDSLPTLDFGDEGLHFDNGLTIVISGAYVALEYI